MGKISFVFPGQGAQFVGMGKDFYDNFDVAKNLFDEAIKYLLLSYHMHNHYILGCFQITSLRYLDGLKITVL